MMSFAVALMMILPILAAHVSIITEKPWDQGKSYLLTAVFQNTMDTISGISFTPARYSNGRYIKDYSSDVIYIQLNKISTSMVNIFVNVDVRFKPGVYLISVGANGGRFDAENGEIFVNSPPPVQPSGYGSYGVKLTPAKSDYGKLNYAVASGVKLKPSTYINDPEISVKLPEPNYPAFNARLTAPKFPQPINTPNSSGSREKYFERLFFGNTAGQGTPYFRRELATTFDGNLNVPSQDQFRWISSPDDRILTIPRTLLSLNGATYLDDAMIWITLQTWYQQVASNEVKLSVAFVNPAYLVGINDDNVAAVLGSNMDMLDKRFFIYPFNSGPGSHWYLIIYDQFLREYFVVDSAYEVFNLNTLRENYLNSIAVFSYILNNYVGIDVNVACDVSFVNIDGMRYLTCPQFNYAQLRNRVYYWQGLSRQHDGHNCGVLSILNGIEIAKNTTILHEYKTKNVQREPYSSDDLTLVRKVLFVEFGARCANSRFDFPACLGLDDNQIENI